MKRKIKFFIVEYPQFCSDGECYLVTCCVSSRDLFTFLGRHVNSNYQVVIKDVI